MDMFGKLFAGNNLTRSRALVAALLLVGSAAGSLSAFAEPQKININTASAAKLSAGLIGVGENKSVAIVKNREAMGVFKLPQDITRVKGIGESTYQKNKDRIVVK